MAKKYFWIEDNPERDHPQKSWTDIPIKRGDALRGLFDMTDPYLSY
jgi:hypothetical protein